MRWSRRPRGLWFYLGHLLMLILVNKFQLAEGVPSYECSMHEECSTKDSNAICNTNLRLCVCANGLYREPPYRTIKCSVGKTYNERCRSPKECLLVDQYSDCIGGVCRCLLGYNPIPGANSSQGSVRCMLDPFYFNADHAHLTFFKVSPVPLLVICIILVYLGYQRGAKVPQRRGSSTSNRRIVPMWRGVTFHQATTPPRNSTSLPNGSSVGSNSSASQNGQTVVMVGDTELRRESSSAAQADRDSRRSRSSAHSQRDSSGRERQERPQQQPDGRGDRLNETTSNRQTERRDSVMSPPPPYAQEDAPPSYEDAIRASRVALGDITVSVDQAVDRTAHSSFTSSDTNSNTHNVNNNNLGNNHGSVLNNGANPNIMETSAAGKRPSK